MVKSLWLKSLGDQPLIAQLLESFQPPVLPLESGREAARIISQDPRVSVLILTDQVDEAQLQQLSLGLAGRGLPVEVICITESDSAPGHLAPLLDQLEIVAWLANPSLGRERFQILLEQVSSKALAMRQLYEIRLGHFEEAGFLGPSLASRQLVKRLSRAALTQEAVLIRGPEGAGKVGLAKVLHSINPSRCMGPFHSLGAKATPAEDCAMRLFGHYRDGHRTGEPVDGLIHQAAGGTLVIEAIEQATVDCQMRLAELLTQGRFVRVGSTQPEPMDAQVVVTTTADLVPLAKAGYFRLDLLNELAANVVELLPLSARREDISPLAVHEARKIFSEYAASRPFPGFTPDAEELLSGTDWPYDRTGVRHFIQRHMLLGGLESEKPISARDLKADLESWITAARTRRPDFCDVEALRLARCLGLGYDRVYHETLAASLTLERRRRTKQEIAELFGKSTRWLEITMNDLSQWMLEKNLRTPEELKRDQLWTRRFRHTPSDTPDPDGEPLV